MLNLSNQATVERTIVDFITVEVIIELPKFYFEAMKEPELKTLMHHPLEVIRKGSLIKFNERPLIDKLERVLYKGLRICYTAILFYFFPFLIIMLGFISPLNLHPKVVAH